MNNFTYRMPMIVYFNEDSNVIEEELAKAGQNILLAYGGGSIKKNGIYDELMAMLTRLDKNVVEFSGRKCRKALSFVVSIKLILS